MKRFSIIVAYLKENRGIGYKNSLPWPSTVCKEDMNRFREITTRTDDPNKMNAVIMGRNTWDSLPDRYRPLPGRYNMVISRTGISGDNLCSFIILDQALEYARYNKNIESIFVIGGQYLYETAIKRYDLDKIYATEIDGIYNCDTFFPKYPGWVKLVGSEVVDNLTFKVYKNVSDPQSEEFQYINCMKRILDNGEKIDDRTGVGTLSLFDENLKFTIETINPDEEDQTKLRYRVPALTTKNLYIKGVVWELLWFLQGRTDANWLKERGVHIWDGHTSREYLDSRGLKDYPEGELGPGYGHQWVKWEDNNGNSINQIQNIIDLLRREPASRRAVLSAWNVGDLDKMALPPCHMMYIFKVSHHQEKKRRLNCKVIIRSNDMFLGNPFNIMSTAILTILMSRVLNMLPGQISISICDAHIYCNHIEPVKIQIGRTPLRFPILEIDKKIDSYDGMCSLVYDDFKMSEYYRWPKLEGMIAI